MDENLKLDWDNVNHEPSYYCSSILIGYYYFFILNLFTVPYVPTGTALNILQSLCGCVCAFLLTLSGNAYIAPMNWVYLIHLEICLLLESKVPSKVTNITAGKQFS